MTTLTAAKRAQFPRRYARKDARRAIYKALYGSPDWQNLRKQGLKRSNDPAVDDFRELSELWDWQNAKHTFDELIDTAQFTPSRRYQLEQRLEQLRHYNGRTAKQKAISATIDAYLATL